MKKIQLPLFVLILAIFACKKSSTTPDAPQEKFMSLSASSTWTYETTSNTITIPNTVTSTSRDTSIGGKTYHVFTNSNGSANDYYNITGSDYYTFRNLTPLGGSPVESIYLKDNAAVGINWSQTVSLTITGVPAPVPVTFTNTITEKGISRTVNGKAYNNVIHITTTLSVTGLPANTFTTDLQFYYAPKVGLIEGKIKISAPSFSINIDQSTILKTSTIN